MDESSPYTAEEIRQALAADSRFGELGIKVRVVDDAVVLSGEVTTQQRRDAATTIVTALAPSLTVRNGLTVKARRQQPDEERIS